MKLVLCFLFRFNRSFLSLEKLFACSFFKNFQKQAGREIRQTKKDKYYMIHLDEVPRVVKFIARESRIVVFWGYRREEQGVIVK